MLRQIPGCCFGNATASEGIPALLIPPPRFPQSPILGTGTVSQEWINGKREKEICIKTAKANPGTAVRALQTLLPAASHEK